MKHLVLTAAALPFLGLATAVPAQQEGTEPDKPGVESLGASTDGFAASDGATLYERACSGCHGPQGGGAYGAGQYPALANNPRLQSGRYVANLILEGNGAMPSFADWLDDTQVAAVVNYLQTNLGNDYEAGVAPDQVDRWREEFADLDGG